MMETLFNWFRVTGIFFEILALLAAMFYFKKYKDSRLCITLPFLTYLLATELFCKYIYHQHNQMFYNPVLIIEGAFYLIGFYFTFTTKLYQQIAVLCLVGFSIMSCINLFTLTSFSNELVTYSYSFGSVLIIGLYLLYMYELLKADESIVFSQQLFFWISNGIFIYLTLRIVPEYILNNRANSLTYNENAILKMIKYLGSDILYFFYTIGFIKCRNRVSYSS